MSIFKPTMSITRFKVSGLPEVEGKDIIQNVLDSLNSFKITDMEIGEEVVWGWTSILNPYEPHFDDMTFITGEYVTVGLRIDKKTIPSKVLKKEIYLAEKKFMEERQIPKISRAQRIIIKESIVANLLKDTPAVPTSYDVVWNVNEQILYLFSTQKLAREIIEDMIRESFNLDITMIFPFTMGINTIDEDALSSAVQPTSFV